MFGIGLPELLIILIILSGLIISILYIRTLSTALSKCSESNRTMTPGLTWLLLIPIINMIFNFYVVLNIAKSLDNEFKNRNIFSDPMPGRTLGLAMCVCAVLTIIPVVGVLASIGALVCWIIYWVKIANYSAMLSRKQLDIAPQDKKHTDQVQQKAKFGSLPEDKRKYFEVPKEVSVFRCSDNQCPCPGTEGLVLGENGYLYISQEVVDMRKDALTMAELNKKQQKMLDATDASMMFFDQGTVYPIVMCEEAVRLRGLDAKTAADDAGHWAKTGLVPLRVTPHN